MTDLNALWNDETPELAPVYFDRSTAEAYATCPFKGLAIETGLAKVCNPAADAGNETHDAIAHGSHEFASGGTFDPAEVEAVLTMSRPDVQAQALAGGRYALWSIRNMLQNRNPNDVLMYQGGEDERSGQISCELLPATETRGPVMATTELDLLLATPSEHELLVVDWKTGRADWNATDVREAFQFRFHNWVLRGVFPDLERVAVRVWATRHNYMTPPVWFDERDARDFHGILLTAAEARRCALADHEAGQRVDTWPALAKCALCDAVLKCPAALEPAADFREQPARYVAETQAMQAAVDRRIAEVLKPWVKENGDIIGSGVAFGTNKPRSHRAPSCEFYDPPERPPVAQQMTDELVSVFKGKAQVRAELVKEASDGNDKD